MTPLLTSTLLRTQSDERLVRLVRDGNERAFDAIVERYRKPLQRYCERALPRSRAEDVVQQVLTKAWCALQDGTEVRSLKPWLYRIAATTAFENAREPAYDFDELRRSLLARDVPDAELEQQTVIRLTLAAVAALPDAQREALLRDAFDGQSRSQIAEALGISEGAVRQLLHRARASLRTAATAFTPLPFVSWLTASGAAPAAGSAVEGGAVGAMSVAGIAKVSAVVAAAGVVATGSAGVHHTQQATKAKARHVENRLVKRVSPSDQVTRVLPVARTQTESQSSNRNSIDEGVSEPDRANGNRDVSHDSGRDEQQPVQQQHDRGNQDRPAPQADQQGAHQQLEAGHGASGDSGQSGSASGDSGN